MSAFSGRCPVLVANPVPPVGRIISPCSITPLNDINVNPEALAVGVAPDYIDIFPYALNTTFTLPGSMCVPQPVSDGNQPITLGTDDPTQATPLTNDHGWTRDGSDYTPGGPLVVLTVIKVMRLAVKVTGTTGALVELFRKFDYDSCGTLQKISPEYDKTLLNLGPCVPQGGP